MMWLAYWLYAACAFALLCFFCWWVGLIRCKHEHISWPMNGIQKCLDCKRFRMNEEGHKPSRWMRGGAK